MRDPPAVWPLVRPSGRTQRMAVNRGPGLPSTRPVATVRHRWGVYDDLRLSGALGPHLLATQGIRSPESRSTRSGMSARRSGGHRTFGAALERVDKGPVAGRSRLRRGLPCANLNSTFAARPRRIRSGRSCVTRIAGVALTLAGGRNVGVTGSAIPDPMPLDCGGSLKDDLEGSNQTVSDAEVSCSTRVGTWR